MEISCLETLATPIETTDSQTNFENSEQLIHPSVSRVPLKGDTCPCQVPPDLFVMSDESSNNSSAKSLEAINPSDANNPHKDQNQDQPSRSSLMLSAETSHEDLFAPSSARSNLSAPSAVGTEDTSATESTFGKHLALGSTNPVYRNGRDGDGIDVLQNPNVHNDALGGNRSTSETSHLANTSEVKITQLFNKPSHATTIDPTDDHHDFTFVDDLEDGDSVLEESWRTAADERQILRDGDIPSGPSRPELDTFLDALIFDSHRAITSSAQSVRSTGSAERRKRRLRRNMAKEAGPLGVGSALSAWQAAQLQAKYSTSSGASTGGSGTVLSSLDSLGTFSLSAASQSRTSEGTRSSKSDIANGYAGSAPISWQRKSRQTHNPFFLSGANSTTASDDFSNKLSASFSSFGQIGKAADHSREIGTSAFHESFHNSIDNFSFPGMLGNFLDLQSSRYPRMSSAHTVAGNNPTREKVSIVMGTTDDEDNYAAFQVGNKEATIIESLLKTTRESSPGRKQEAMMDWLQSTAAELLSPTQHDFIVDSARMSNRSSMRVEISPPFEDKPSVSSRFQRSSYFDSSGKFAPGHGGEVASARYKGRSTQDMIELVEREKMAQSLPVLSTEQSMFASQRSNVFDQSFYNESEILQETRPFNRAHSIAVERPSRSTARNERNSSKRVRSSSDPRRRRERNYPEATQSPKERELEDFKLRTASPGRPTNRRTLMRKMHQVAVLSEIPISRTASKSPRRYKTINKDTITASSNRPRRMVSRSPRRKPDSAIRSVSRSPTRQNYGSSRTASKSPRRPKAVPKESNATTSDRLHRTTSKSPRRHKSVTKDSVPRQGSKRPNKQSPSSDTKNKGLRKGRKKQHSRHEDEDVEMDVLELNKSFLDKFLDHDVEANDSASQFMMSPGGTRRKKMDMKEYKATLIEAPIQESESKLRIDPDFLESSQRMILQDPVSRRTTIKKMKSVPALGCHSDKLVELFFSENKGFSETAKPQKKEKSKKNKSKKGSPKTRKIGPPKKKEKKQLQESNVLNKSQNDIFLLEKVTLNDLPRQSESKVDEKGPVSWRLSGTLKKAKSLSNLDQKEYEDADRELLVERLKALSNTNGESETYDKLATIPEKKKQRDKSKDKRAPRRCSSAIQTSSSKKMKKKKAPPPPRGMTKPVSVRNMRNTDLRKLQSEVRWSSVPRGIGANSMEDFAPGTPNSGRTSSKKLPLSRKASDNSKHTTSSMTRNDDADNEPEIIDIVSPPLKPVRKNSRKPGESSLREFRIGSISTPNLFPSSEPSIPEGSVLELADDGTACSELTETYFVELKGEPASKDHPLNQSKGNLSAISEGSTSWGGLSMSDSMTHDKSLHLNRRWDTNNSNNNPILKSPIRYEDGKEKKKFGGWLKNKIPFMKKI